MTLVNPGGDANSRGVFALIFNGLSQALTAQQWMPLGERHRIAEAIFKTLYDGGIEIRLIGLAWLRAVAVDKAADIAEDARRDQHDEDGAR